MLYTDDMKTKIVIWCGLAVIIGLLAFGISVQYQKYKQQKAQDASTQQEQANKAQTALSDKTKELETANVTIASLRAECEKGLAAYGLLPATTKTKTAQPDCQ